MVIAAVWSRLTYSGFVRKCHHIPFLVALRENLFFKIQDGKWEMILPNLLWDGAAKLAASQSPFSQLSGLLGETEEVAYLSVL